VPSHQSPVASSRTATVTAATPTSSVAFPEIDTDPEGTDPPWTGAAIVVSGAWVSPAPAIVNRVNGGSVWMLPAASSERAVA
jgi:hypothetical protein